MSYLYNENTSKKDVNDFWCIFLVHFFRHTKKGPCSGYKDLIIRSYFRRGTGIRTRDLQLPKLAR